MPPLVKLVVALAALAAVCSVYLNLVLSLVRGLRFGAIKTGFYGGQTVYRSLEAGRY